MSQASESVIITMGAESFQSVPWALPVPDTIIPSLVKTSSASPSPADGLVSFANEKKRSIKALMGSGMDCIVGKSVDAVQ